MKNIKNKKRNGFTLIELLAVIVVLAIIMIIAIPAIMDTMNGAKRESFKMYIEKCVTAAQTQYTYDTTFGTFKTNNTIAYDITKDFNLTSTGNYKGYVVVSTNTSTGKVTYKVYITDTTFMINQANYTKLADTDVVAYNATTWANNDTIDEVCPTASCTKRS